MNILHPHARFSFGSVVYPPGGTLGPRLQTHVQLVLVHRGEARVEVNGALRHLSAGEATLLLPGREERFEFARQEETHHTWVHEELPALSPALEEFLLGAPDVVPITLRMQTLMSWALGERQSSRTGRLEVLEQLGNLLLLEFVQAAGLEPGDLPEGPEPVRRALDAIRGRFAEPLDLPALARIAGVSPQHLMRLFRQHCGASPVRTLWQTRTEEAIRAILETGLSLTEIAERCGFQNVYHLSRLVRKRTGSPPRQLRERHWRRNHLIDQTAATG